MKLSILVDQVESYMYMTCSHTLEIEKEKVESKSKSFCTPVLLHLPGTVESRVVHTKDLHVGFR
jgi:hypothetical protein